MRQTVTLPADGFEMELQNYEPLLNLLYGYNSDEIAKLLDSATSIIKEAKGLDDHLKIADSEEACLLIQLSEAFKELREKPVVYLCKG